MDMPIDVDFLTVVFGDAQVVRIAYFDESIAAPYIVAVGCSVCTYLGI